jgi:hypothetical protein
MRLNLLLLLIAGVAAGILWLCAGRLLTLLIDRLITVKVVTMPVDNLEYDGGGFQADGISMTFGGIDNQRFNLTLCTDASHKVVLTSGGRSFTLGPRSNPVDASGRPEIYFVPDHGDEVSLSVTRSFLPWPTPFEIYLMIKTPWWKRYVYYRLDWKKRSGAELAMHWRYEQDYFAERGWIEPTMMWNSQTGLLRLNIFSPASPAN